MKVHYPIRSGFFNRVTDRVYAVDGINIEFDEGKTYGLVGESGSGKSTIGSNYWFGTCDPQVRFSMKEKIKRISLVVRKATLTAMFK